MISLNSVLRIHKLLISEFGGSSGLRDRNGLKSALMRPQATFDGKELYQTAVEKAAAILESILINHPFIDGNKRMGYVLMQLTLMENKISVEATEDEKYDMIILVAMGELDHAGICKWLDQDLKKE